MEIGLWKKGLVVGIIVLFVTVSLSPVVTAVNNKTEADDEPLDNSDDIGTSDEYEEIITFITGYAWLDWIKRRGYFRGEVNLICYKQSSFIILFGFRRSESGIEFYNELIAEDIVYAYRFIGYSTGYSYYMFDPGILGIAIGNIEWS